MEEVTSGASGFGVVVDLPIDVVEDLGLVRVGALDREGGGGFGFGAGFLVDGSFVRYFSALASATE